MFQKSTVIKEETKASVAHSYKFQTTYIIFDTCKLLEHNKVMNLMPVLLVSVDSYVRVSICQLVI